jgi:LPPG:FO 2-phospho-L-lactate transferase
LKRGQVGRLEPVESQRMKETKNRENFKIAALAGGVGAARFLEGLVRVMDPRNLTVIVNTADDIEFFGLHVSPDVDIVTYTLGGVINPKTGWGFRRDTFFCLDQLHKLGQPDWFQLGDRDLAVHILRSRLLSQGWSLTRITDAMRRSFGVVPKILPMSDRPVTTRMVTNRGTFHFQEYLVRRKARDPVRRVRFAGIRRAEPSSQVLQAIREAEGIILCPSNPVVSIGPILFLPGLRAALRKTSAKILAVSPIVAGRPIKGPAAQIMSGIGLEVSAAQVARLYRDFLDVFVIDRQDASAAETIRSQGVGVVVADTIMKDLRSKTRLAQAAYSALALSP